MFLSYEIDRKHGVLRFSLECDDQFASCSIDLKELAEALAHPEPTHKVCPECLGQGLMRYHVNTKRSKQPCRMCHGQGMIENGVL